MTNKSNETLLELMSSIKPMPIEHRAALRANITTGPVFKETEYGLIFDREATQRVYLENVEFWTKVLSK